jgi:hypothetical protein
VEGRRDEVIRDGLHDCCDPGDVEVDSAVRGAIGSPQHVDVADGRGFADLREEAREVGGVVLVGVP